VSSAPNGDATEVEYHVQELHVLLRAQSAITFSGEDTSPSARQPVRANRYVLISIPSDALVSAIVWLAARTEWRKTRLSLPLKPTSEIPEDRRKVSASCAAGISYFEDWDGVGRRERRRRRRMRWRKGGEGSMSDTGGSCECPSFVSIACFVLSVCCPGH
jgi:hypothetical protein